MARNHVYVLLHLRGWLAGSEQEQCWPRFNSIRFDRGLGDPFATNNALKRQGWHELCCVCVVSWRSLIAARSDTHAGNERKESPVRPAPAPLIDLIALRCLQLLGHLFWVSRRVNRQ
jgi:hypothetical protein